MATSRIARPRTRSTLPAAALSTPAQPATHRTAVIRAGSEANAPPGPALALSVAPSSVSSPHITATIVRFSSPSSPRAA